MLIFGICIQTICSYNKINSIDTTIIVIYCNMYKVDNLFLITVTLLRNILQSKISYSKVML